MENGQNTGVYLLDRGTDFIAGAETGITYEVRNESGDWEQYKPTDEWQRKIGGYDTLSCVTFSALNQVELQVQYLIVNKLLSDAQIQKLHDLGYIDENGRPNFNDWFSSVMDNTTVNGNYLQAPWDSFRKDGLLPQKMGYAVTDFNSQAEWLAAKPTQAQKDYAKQILDIIDIAYEWIPVADKAKHLKQSPLHILTPTSSNWNTQPPTIITDPGMKSVNHATTCIGVTDTYVKDLDHYNPFIKYLALDYYIPYVIKGVVSPKKDITDEWSNFTYQFNINLSFGDNDTTEVNMLQRALQKLGYMTKGNYGPFGPATKAALYKFQIANGITGNYGVNFGPLTRKTMNNLMK